MNAGQSGDQYLKNPAPGADRSEALAHIDSKRHRKRADVIDRDVSLGPQTEPT
jgi:hypothetical protein